MGDFLSSVLPPGLLDVLSALIPPVVVAFVFCYFIIKVLRREMAPRRMDGSLVGKGAQASSGPADENTRVTGETGATNGTANVRSAEGEESGDR
ncbi:hypothetical protein ACFVWN_23805 [Nocardiopsis flavescens]|uniref:Uncharacterized protein n=1 Tax=Nocardiopsis flavescens TaxID=758803 RepID=A0A1M6P2N6_9ACTN|nr:hypothetical protein [Nocardiopsis flavescens]SHK02267.1 hypothetical protein SAMN05421803_112223 [Nocardiopsis flavescens]